MPDMWVRCDAGWGRIEEILDVVKRPLSAAERTNKFVRYQVTLRPHQDAERIELDVSASRIKFLNAQKVYTCTKCQGFSATEAQLITDMHNEAAHDGLSPAYKTERKPERKLSQLFFSTRKPDLRMVVSSEQRES